MALPRGVRLRVAALLGTVVCVNAAYTVLIPFVPELPARLGASQFAVGLAFTLFAGGKLLAQPVGGVAVDRWGPRGVAVLALGLVAAGTVATALAGDTGTLLVGRTAWGLGEGVLTPALYAGMTHLCHRYQLPTARMVGRFGSAAIAGFLVGPLVTGLAGGVGFRALFLLGAAVTVLSAFALARVLPPAAPPAEPDAPVPSDAPVTSDTAVTADTAVTSDTPGSRSVGRWWVWVLVFGCLDLVTNLTYSALEPVLPLHLAGGTGDSRAAVSAVFASGLAVFGVTAWLVGRAGERLPVVRLVRIGLAVSVVGVAGLAVSDRLVPVLGFFAVVMVGQSALYLAARRGVIEVRAGLSRHGRAFGLFGATSDLGNVLGPSLGTALHGWLGQGVFPLLAAPSAALLLALRSLRAPTTGPLAAGAPAGSGR